MTEQNPSKCKLNLISGQLGAGKTTFLRQLLTDKPATEKWVVLVNEFGSVGIDGAILSEQQHTQVEQIPGGCICCTAKNELTETVLSILDHQAPDRILIEPTGLGEPQSLLDIFLTPTFEGRLEIHTLFALFDLAQTEINEIKRLSILQSLISMADVIILNKADVAAAEKIEKIQNYLGGLYPPKTAIITTQQAKIDSELISQPHFHSSQFILKNLLYKLTTAKTASPRPITDTGIELSGCLARQSHQDLDTLSLGWIFDRETQFDWKKCQALFKQLAEMPDGLLRAKGVFRVGETPRMLFQLAHKSVSRELIAYRKDSRLEVLLAANHDFDLIKFEQQLADAITTERTA